MSPSERFVAMWLLSGQSDIGYELFEVRPLRHVASLPYSHGEGPAPAFSPDERFVAMCWMRGQWQYEYPSSIESEPWATLHVRTIAVNTTREVALFLETPRDFDIDDTTPRELAFVSPTVLRLTTPWGSTSVDLTTERDELRLSF